MRVLREILEGVAKRLGELLGIYGERAKMFQGAPGILSMMIFMVAVWMSKAYIYGIAKHSIAFSL